MPAPEPVVALLPSRRRSPAGRPAAPSAGAGWPFLLLATLLAVAPVPAAGPKEFPPITARADPPARIVLDRGIPVVHLHGTHREMGQQAGRLLAPQIRWLIDNYVFEVVTAEQRRRFLPSVKAVEWRIPAPLREEMRGMAEGAGIDYDDILFANLFVDIGQAMACSTLALLPERSRPGKVMLARNLEFLTLGIAQDADAIFVYHGDGAGPAVASIGWPGMVGVVTGMNSEGLTAAMLVSLQSNPQLSAIPSVLAFRDFLERHAAITEAPAYFADNKVILPSNLALADAAATSVIELNPYTGIGVRHPKDGFLVCTNLFAGALDNDTDGDWRFQQLSKDAVAKPVSDFTDLRAYLGDAMLQGDRIDNFQAMIFIPADRMLYLSALEVPAATGRYLRFDLGKLFAVAPLPVPATTDPADGGAPAATAPVP